MLPWLPLEYMQTHIYYNPHTDTWTHVHVNVNASVSDDPPPFIDGVRINSPHYLCKMVVQPGTNVYTLVVSQYERNNTIHYTLRVYSSTEFKLTRIVPPYNPKYDRQVH